jgi:hypothetical protein
MWPSFSETDLGVNYWRLSFENLGLLKFTSLTRDINEVRYKDISQYSVLLWDAAANLNQM